MPLYLLITAMLLGSLNTDDITAAEGVALPQVYTVCVSDSEEQPVYARDSCMTGIYMGNNAEVDSFEAKAEVEGDVRIFKLGLRENVPLRQIKDCSAEGKLPMLVIDDIASEDRIKSVAESIGYINLPVLVELNYGSDKEAYNSHSRLIKSYADKAAVVWGVDGSCADYARYYPEDSLVDYVAVNVTERSVNGVIKPERENIKRACDYFRHKGIILNVGISHFSSRGYSYNIQDACEELRAVYELVRYEPNIYVVNYFSISDFDEGEAVYRDSFKLTESEELIKAYSEAVLSLRVERYYRETATVAYRIGESFVIGDRGSGIGSLPTAKAAYSNLRTLEVSLYDDKLKKVFVNQPIL